MTSAPNYAIKNTTVLAILDKLSSMTGVSKAQILLTWATRDYDAIMAGAAPAYGTPAAGKGTQDGR